MAENHLKWNAITSHTQNSLTSDNYLKNFLHDIHVPPPPPPPPTPSPLHLLPSPPPPPPPPPSSSNIQDQCLIITDIYGPYIMICCFKSLKRLSRSLRLMLVHHIKKKKKNQLSIPVHFNEQELKNNKSVKEQLYRNQWKWLWKMLAQTWMHHSLPHSSTKPSLSFKMS